MRKNSIGVLVLSLLVFCLCTVTSSNAQSSVQSLVIDTAYHHLGNDNVTSMHNQSPEGTTWTKNFFIDSSLSSITSTIIISVCDLQFADLIINGIRIAIPPAFSYSNSNSLVGQLSRNIAVSVPAGFFKFGDSNTISIESIQEPTGGNYDDFEFNSVSVYFHIYVNPGTAVTLTPDLKMHLPNIEYNTLLGIESIWADLAYDGTKSDAVYFKVTGAGAN